MNFQQCHYLLAIAKYHSISRAAQASFVTQPSISKAIHELEAELGIQVLKRTNRGVRFTKDGRDLLQYAALLVEEERSLYERFHRQPRRQALTVASQHYGFVTTILEQAMAKLAGQAYQLNLKEGRLADVINQVANGSANLGVIAIATANRQLVDRQLARSRVAFHELAASPVKVFLRRNHPLAHRQYLRPDQLTPFPSLTYRQNDPVLALLEGPSLHPHPERQVVFVDDRATMDSLLADTDGYNIGTGIISDKYMDEHIIAVPLAVPWQIKVGYLTKKNYQPNPIAAWFIAALQRQVQNINRPQAFR